MADQDASPEILAVRQHLVSHLGAPADVVAIRGNPDPDAVLQEIEVATFAPGGTDQPVVFATCGVSRVEMQDGRYVEAMIIVNRMPSAAHTEAIHKLLGSFALFAENNAQPVGLGDVVRSKDDVQTFSEMDALVFMPPLPFVESFHEFSRADGAEVEYIWLLPVYEDEAQYALDHGPGPLMMVFAAQRLDLTRMDREEANTLVSPEDAALLAEAAEREAIARGDDGRPRPDDARRAPKPQVEIDPDAMAAFSATAGAVTIQRRPKPAKKAPPPAAEPDAPAETEAPPEGTRGSSTDRPRGPAPGRPAVKRPPVRKKKRRKKKKVVRFDLPSDPGPELPEEFVPDAPPPPMDPEEARRQKIERLKAQAQARAAGSRSDNDDVPE